MVEPSSMSFRAHVFKCEKQYLPRKTLSSCKGFINILSRETTGFIVRLKLFKLNFHLRKMFSLMVKPSTKIILTAVQFAGCVILNETPVQWITVDHQLDSALSEEEAVQELLVTLPARLPVSNKTDHLPSLLTGLSFSCSLSFTRAFFKESATDILSFIFGRSSLT